jgi:inhibitor of KinA
VIIRPASDRSLLVSFGSEISPDAHRQVLRLTKNLAGRRPVLNLHPAFASVLIDFDPRRHRFAEIEALVHNALDSGEDDAAIPERTVEIPVCYGGESGPDLEAVAEQSGLTPQGVIELHTAAEYVVYFLGFATCFVYLGGLPAALATPRLAAPRTRVPGGSVGIAGNQAGIYPLASPGGWRLIGRTAMPLFDPEQAPPAALRMGDRVRFLAAEVRL